MCYELSEWSRKLRAAALARKERDVAKTAKMQDEPVTTEVPPAQETRVKERESAPA